MNCAVFRNESDHLSSDLIREAMAIAWARWPGERLYTYVDPTEVASRNPGYCFKVAGWRTYGRTKKGLIILEALPREIRVVAPYTVPRYGERDGQAPRCGSIDQPSPTIVGTGNGAQLVAAMLNKHYGGVIGKPVDQPADTVTSVDHHAVTTVAMRSASAPLDRGPGSGSTIGDSAANANESRDDDGQVKAAEAECRPCRSKTSSCEPPAASGDAAENRAAERVAAFLTTYYGNGGASSPEDPAPTVTGRDRFGLVTVAIDGETYVITDIAMRMLTPRELARCQGFEDDYVIDRTADGQRVTKADQVKLVGNSVCPPIARAIVRENVVRQGVLESTQPAAKAKGVA